MEENEIIIKPFYKSKKDILNRMPRLQTEKDDNISEIFKIKNQHLIHKKFKYLEKKNLTYQNFLEYTYDYTNITEKKIKFPDHLKIKQKYELMLGTENSFFIPKKSIIKNTPLLITGLNTLTNKKNNKFNNLFSSSQKSLENNSELKTKSSSNKFTRSNFFNNNLSNKNEFLFPSSEISKSVIRFHGDVEKFTKNENKDEGLKAFVQKSKIILKEKIIQKELRDKLNYQNELNNQEIIAINKKEKQLYKNFELLDKFEKEHINYIRDLIEEELKERRHYYLLNTKKLSLENDIANLHKKIEKIKVELTKYESLKRFFRHSKSGFGFLSTDENTKIEDNKPKKINKPIFTDVNNQDITQRQIGNFKKNFKNLLNKSMLAYRQKFPIKKKDTFNKQSVSKLNSLKPNVKKIEEKIIPDNVDKNNNNDDEKKNIKIIKNLSNRRKSKRKSSMLVHQKQYEHMFTNEEKLILKNIEIYNKKRDEIYEGKKQIEENNNHFKIMNKYSDELIAQKEHILSRLKEDNENLEIKLKLIKKTKNKKDLSKVILEKKMIDLLYKIQTKINIPDILKDKNIFSMIELKSEDFLEKFRTQKILYLIKTIELIITYLITKKKEYLSDPKQKETLKNFLFALENDKKNRMNKLNKKILKREMDNKIIKAYERATKVRFFPYRPLDLSHFKNRRHHILKEKVNNLTEKDNQYDEWLLYD